MKSLQDLEELGLSRTRITDDSVLHLAKLKSLVHLVVLETQLSRKAVDDLQQALPGCLVESDYSPRDNDRTLAEWVLRMDGQLRIFTDGQLRDVESLSDLPASDFRLSGIDLSKSKWVKDAALRHISKRAARTSSLKLAGTGITTRGVLNLMDYGGLMKQLQELDVSNTAVSDGCFRTEHQLVRLDMSGTKVTDATLAVVAGWPKLENVGVRDTAITDRGLLRLESMTNLRQLDVRGTKVSRPGVEALQAAQPECRIIWDGDAAGAGK